MPHGLAFCPRDGIGVLVTNNTTHLIHRAVNRLIRAGGRKTAAEAAHLLEGIGVVMYDPHKARIVPDLPVPGSGLRWEEFVEDLITAYDACFED